MGRDSYIVRIYSRAETTGLEQEGESMNGIIEDTETGTKYTFHTMKELWGFMAEHQKKIPDKPKTTN